MWYYGPRFNFIDIGWLELKTSNFYAMPMLSYSKPDSFEMCRTHEMACYYLIDSSALSRNNNQHGVFVFLKLHNVSENTEPKDLAQVIREKFPPDLSEKNSCKIWRKGGIKKCH